MLKNINNSFQNFSFHKRLCLFCRKNYDSSLLDGKSKFLKMKKIIATTFYQTERMRRLTQPKMHVRVYLSSQKTCTTTQFYFSNKNTFK